MLLCLIRQDAAPGSVSSQTGLSFMVLQELQTIQRGHWVPRPDFLGSGHDRFLETTTFINDSFKHLTWDGHRVFQFFEESCFASYLWPQASGLRPAHLVSTIPPVPLHMLGPETKQARSYSLHTYPGLSFF